MVEERHIEHHFHERKPSMIETIKNLHFYNKLMLKR